MYQYRADGMRIQKVTGDRISWNAPNEEEDKSGYYDNLPAVNQDTTRWFYDGQMAIEEEFRPEALPSGITYPNTGKEVTEYGLGARGIDYIHWTIDGGEAGPDPVTRFPIYDGHGNMIAQLQRSGNNSYALSDKKLYDAWGSVRWSAGAANGEPKTRYCGNLGHVQDDDSGLIYVRARYCEPSSGRFISEDPERAETNFYVYCGSRPIDNVDPTGEFTLNSLSLGMVIGEGLLAGAIDAGLQYVNHGHINWTEVAIATGIGMATAGVFGHLARLRHYLQTTMGRWHWYEGVRDGTFMTFFLKFIGHGTGNSLTKHHYLPLFRALIVGGGASLFSDMCNAFVLGFIEFE